MTILKAVLGLLFVGIVLTGVLLLSLFSSVPSSLVDWTEVVVVVIPLYVLLEARGTHALRRASLVSSPGSGRRAPGPAPRAVKCALHRRCLWSRRRGHYSPEGLVVAVAPRLRRLRFARSDESARRTDLTQSLVIFPEDPCYLLRGIRVGDLHRDLLEAGLCESSASYSFFSSAPATHPDHSSTLRATPGGTETANRPPGLRTLKASPITCGFSGEGLITQLLITTSKSAVDLPLARQCTRQASTNLYHRLMLNLKHTFIL